jgi:hypothetical protein
MLLLTGPYVEILVEGSAELRVLLGRILSVVLGLVVSGWQGL